MILEIIKELVKRKPTREMNPRKGTLAHEDFLYCFEQYLKVNNIDRSVLDLDGIDLIDLYENYRDAEINALLKKYDSTLPDIRLPYNK